MADTLDITAGAGTTIATDDVGGAHYQRIKLSDGTADATGIIAADIGVKANALRVAPANDITAATYIGNVVVTSGAITETNSASLAVVGGGAEATALRVTLANDSTGVVTVDGTVTADLSVTDNAVLDAIDTVLDLINAKLVTGTVIGDVNLGATDNAVLDAMVVDLAAIEVLQTTIAGDTTSIDGKITACNTGAVVLSSGTVTTVSTVTNLSQLGGTAISMNEGVLDAGVQRVTLATDDDGVAHLATIAADTTAIETAIQIIDDWDATHAGAAVADGPQIMGAGYSTALPADVGADADAARICTDRYGRVLAGLMPQNFQATMTSADAQVATPVKVKTADRKMYILSLIASTDTALNLQFQDDTGPTVLIEGIYLAANGGFVMNWPPEAPLVVNTNEDFDVIASAAGNISVTITGYLAV